MTHPSSLETILSDHGPFLRRLARALVSDSHLADDLVQDTWSAAITSPGRPAQGQDGGRTRAWLATVLRQLAYSHFRKAGVRSHAELPAEHPGTEEGAREMTERLERDSLVHKALKAMKEPYRSVLVLKYHDGCRTSEIAEKLGVTESTVRTQLGRGVERMRVALDRAYGDEEDPRSAWLAAFAPLLRAAPSAGASTSAAVKAGGRAAASHGPLWAFAAVAALVAAAAVLIVHRGHMWGGPNDPAPSLGLSAVEAPPSADAENVHLLPTNPRNVAISDAFSRPNSQESAATRTSAAPGEGRSITEDALTALPALTSSIRGSVRLADGTPVANRIIEARRIRSTEAPTPSGEPAPSSRPVETRTAKDGSYRFMHLPEGAYDLAVDASIDVDSATLDAILTGTTGADLILDAILVHASLPPELRSPTKGRSLAVKPSFMGPEEFQGVGMRNFQLDGKGGVTLLLPRGPGYGLTYRSSSHQKHGATLPAELPPGSYSKELADSDPALGAVHVVVQGEAIPGNSRLYIGLEPVADPARPGNDSDHVFVHAPARSARNGLVEPGRYRVEASVSQQLLERWLIVSCSAEFLAMDAGGEATLEVLMEPAGALTLNVEPTAGISPSELTYGTLRAEILDEDSGTWRPMELSRILGDPTSIRPESSTGGPLLPGEPRYNFEPLPVGLLQARLIGDGWRTHQETLEIRAGERTPWNVRLERTD